MVGGRWGAEGGKVGGKSLLSPAAGDVPPIKPQLPGPQHSSPESGQKLENWMHEERRGRGAKVWFIPRLSLHTLESFLAKVGIEKFAKILSLALTEEMRKHLIFLY